MALHRSFVVLLLLAVLYYPTPTVAQGQNITVSYPVTVEFDLVFPRNDTYAPAPVFPVVFAVQNLPEAAVSSSLYLDWYLTRAQGEYLETGRVDFDRVNASSNPYFVVGWTGKINSTESADTYTLLWSFRHPNCSLGMFGSATDFDSSEYQDFITFTVAAGGKQPDFAADRDTCPTRHATFEQTGTLPAAGTTWNNYNSARDVCGVLATSPPPANPCAAKINDAAASSILAELTTSACAHSPPALSSGCPPPTDTSVGTRAQVGRAGADLGLLLAGVTMLVQL
ncbi:hypothetical protein C8A01DRAFT_17577 [Parachaetomium inaequale]|uniref:DUF7136 domain-containing protein n=1 Tax=Parachaetomium inaequale TaxID=2588326 RepID=A0AAN6SQF2_9PEZI|nr:hypothetical protein C8A01DRAFT_17577 [Parachaetomium inaequale]